MNLMCKIIICICAEISYLVILQSIYRGIYCTKEKRLIYKENKLTIYIT